MAVGMKLDDEKVLLNEIDDQRNFRSALMVRIENLMKLSSLMATELHELHDRVDQYIDAQSVDVKGDR